MDCPNCRVPLRGDQDSCPCGWIKDDDSDKKAGDRGRCINVDLGHRCEMPGHLSDRKSGAAGFYCAWHYHCRTFEWESGRFEKFSQWMDRHGYRGNKETIWRRMTGREANGSGR